MGQIVLNIAADSPAEMIGSLRELLSAMEAVGDAGSDAGVGAPASGSSTSGTQSSGGVNAGGAQGVPGSEPDGVNKPAGKRGSRAKKETPAPAPTQPPAAPSASSLDSMFSDVGSTSTTGTPATRVVTRDQLKEIGNKHMEALGIEATVSLLAEFQVGKLSELKEEQYGNVYAAFEKKLKARSGAASLLS